MEGFFSSVADNTIRSIRQQMEDLNPKVVARDCCLVVYVNLGVSIFSLLEGLARAGTCDVD